MSKNFKGGISMKHYKELFFSLALSVSMIAGTIPVKAYDLDTKTITRLGGNDRFETAISISKEYCKDSKTPVDTVLLGRCDDFADTLSIAPFSVYKNAPLLLTEKDSLNKKTEARLKEMKIKNVYIIGGTGVVGSNVESKLKSLGYTVSRIGGKDRIETNRLLMKQIPVSIYGPNPKIINGYDWIQGMSVCRNTIEYDSKDRTTRYINPVFVVNADAKDYDDIAKILEPVQKKFNTEYPVKKNYTSKYQVWADDYTLSNIRKTIDYNLICKYFGVSNMNGLSTSNWIKGSTLANIQITYDMYQSSDRGFKADTTNHENAVLLARSDNFIDSLASCPLSAEIGAPIVMSTYSVVKAMGYDAKEDRELFFSNLSVRNEIYYLGGEAAVPNGTEKFLKGGVF